MLKEYKGDITPAEPKDTTDIEKVFEYTNSVLDWESNVDSITYVEKSKLSGLVVYVKW